MYVLVLYEDTQYLVLGSLESERTSVSEVTVIQDILYKIRSFLSCWSNWCLGLEQRPTH